MPLEYDPNTSEILYEGKLVGKYTVEEGVGRVSLNLVYKCKIEEWIVPLSWFDYGLAMLEKHKQQEESILIIETSEDQIAQEYQVRRTLFERTVKRNGYVWQFHKNDLDAWPSELHGHDYEKNLILDAITGEIYDKGTRELCKKLKTEELQSIQSQLRGSSDFAERVTQLIGDRAV